MSVATIPGNETRGSRFGSWSGRRWLFVVCVLIAIAVAVVLLLTYTGGGGGGSGGGGY